MDDTLSHQLDEARAKEAHYRALLLFWKQRRQSLEARIPVYNVVEEAYRIITDAFDGDARLDNDGRME